MQSARQTPRQSAPALQRIDAADAIDPADVMRF
jgi:hypothetical protein